MAESDPHTHAHAHTHTHDAVPSAPSATEATHGLEPSDVSTPSSTGDVHVMLSSAPDATPSTATDTLIAKPSTKPSSTGDGHGTRVVSAKSFRTCCGLSVFCFALVFSIAVAGLVLSLRLYRPDVYLAVTATSSYGYTYGGAVHQGSGMWVTNKPLLPTARSDLCAVSVGDVVYLLGGVDLSNTVLAAVLAFNAVHEVYNTSKTPMPVPRYRFAAAAIDRLIYVVGGVQVYDGNAIATLNVYDTVSDTWRASLPSMSLPRSDLAAAAQGGKLYVFGGYGINFDMSVTGRLVEVFDPALSSWRTLAPMPTSRGDLVALTFDNKIYAMGGWRDDDSTNGPGGDFQAAAEAYDPASNTWQVLANMLTRKGDSAAAVYRNTIVTVGGEIWSGRTEPCYWDPTTTCKVNLVPTHDAVSFLPDVSPPTAAQLAGAGGVVSGAGINGGMGVWVSHAPMPGARFRFAAASVPVSQAVYVFGGTGRDGMAVDTVTAFYDTQHPRVFMHYKDGSTWW